MSARGEPLAAGPRRRGLAWLTLALLLLSVAPAGAQDDAADDDQAQLEASPEEGAEGAGDGEIDDVGNIDDILSEDEEVLSGAVFGYDPGNRRDPFRSLLQESRPGDIEEERPEGIAGLLIDELELEGVFFTEEGPIAQVQTASSETSYLLRPGDQLWDGDVVSISLEEVVFKQSINDPTALKPFRDIVKRLSP